MRLNKILLILILIVISPTFFGQSLENDDLKCEKILQEVSDNIQKNNASKFNFKLEIKSEDINEIQNGYALIEKEKFYYKTGEREVICDGVNVWTYLPEDNECYIDLLEDLDNTLNPSEIFTLWKKGFKFKYMNKTIVNNQTIHKIKMFPSQPDKSTFHTIIMEVNESLKLISEASRLQFNKPNYMEPTKTLIFTFIVLQDVTRYFTYFSNFTCLISSFS